jgi:hypothetical protein
MIRSGRGRAAGELFPPTRNPAGAVRSRGTCEDYGEVRARARSVARGVLLAHYSMTTGKGRPLDVQEAARLVQPRDTVLCGFAAGQPTALLEALGARTDLEEVTLFTGLLIRPYAVLQNPGVRVMSGFFGPIERRARSARRSSTCRRTSTVSSGSRCA